jgi:hypothetical protein
LQFNELDVLVDRVWHAGRVKNRIAGSDRNSVGRTEQSAYILFADPTGQLIRLDVAREAEMYAGRLGPNRVGCMFTSD